MLHENQEYCKLLDPRIIKFLESRGYTDFYPPQWEAIKPGLENRNLIISIPTASGKTLIAEIIALQRLFQASQESDIESLPEKTATSTTKTASYKKHKEKKILYLTPLKALAQEKYLEFKQNWSSLGFRVGISTSDIDHPDIRIFQNDLIFLTNEKADSLLRSNPDLMQEIQLVIADEIHLLNDTGRGVTLEFLLTCLRTLNSNIQLIGLSATIQNANELAEWLNAELIESQWRPVELREGFYINGEIQFKNGEVRRVPKIPGHDDVTTLTIDMFKQGGSLLIFANSRRNAMSTAELLSPVLRIIADSSEKATFKNVQTEYQNKIADKSQISKKLEQTLIGGVAFHHAGLSSKQLNFIVSKFNAREIRVICCTPTLAAGVNTPARRVIIKTLYRYSGDEGSKLIPILEYKQMAGRAGRPEFDEYGEVIILGSRPEKLVENALAYINGKPEPITSKLTDEHLLKSHILGLIASQTANTLNSITQILANSFYYYQLNHGNYLSAQLQKVSNKSSNYKSRQRTSNLLKQHSQISKIRKQGGRGEDPLKMFSESDNLFTTASDLLDNQTKITEESSEIGSDSRSDKSTNSPYPQLKISSEQLLNSDKDVKKRISEMLEYFQSNDLIQECVLTEKSNSKQELESESEQKHKLEQKQDHKQDHKQDQKQDQKQEQRLKCTKFGKICVQSYILPDDAVIIRENLVYAAVLNQNHEIALTEVSWLHLIAQLDAFRKPFVQKNNYPSIIQFIEDHTDNFIMEEVWEPTNPKFSEFAKEIKLTMILYDWVSEVHENIIVERYNIGPGDLHRFVNNAFWLTRVLRRIAPLELSPSIIDQISLLQIRVLNGIRPALAPLIKFKGVGRLRARKLYHAGFTSIDLIKNATIEKLMQVPLIGLSLAKSIKDQCNKLKSKSNSEKSIIKQNYSNESADIHNYKSYDGKNSKESKSKHKEKSLDDFFS